MLLPKKKPSIKQGLPVKKKALLTVAFLSVLLLSAVAGTQFVDLGQANPYMYYEYVSPPAGATPLVISVSSPKNNAVYRVTDIVLAFNVSTQGTSLNSIYGIYFKANWMQDNVTVYKQNSQSPEFPTFWSYDETFLDMPDGEYSVVITAWGGGGYAESMTAYSFDMTSTLAVNFTIATPPEVSILSPLNKTYDSSDVPLNFTVNESFSRISYVLDYQDNITIAENTTLTDLGNGYHNVTVYAIDSAGNTGTSETIYFNGEAPEPFPTVTVAAVSGASAVVVVAGLLVYFKKRKR
jgi:hypothetical protein